MPADVDTVASRMRRPQADEAYHRLRLEILTFGLKPGERLSEVQMSERFKLPLGAIRAAIPRLRTERLLINKKRLGQMVAPISLHDIQTTWEVRLLLEPAAARKAVPNLDVAELKGIEDRVAQEAEPGDKEAQIASMFASRDFHMLIAEKSDNPTLCEYIRQLQDRMIRFQYLLRSSEHGSREWRHGHAELMDCIERRDAEGAGAAMHDHIAKGHRMMMDAVLELRELKNVNIGTGLAD